MKFKLINELLSEIPTTTKKKGMKMGLFAANDYSKITNIKQRQHILSITVLSQINQQLQSQIQTSLSKKHNLIKSRPMSRLTSQLEKKFQTELPCQFKSQDEDANRARESIVIAECDKKRRHLLQTIR